jgi:hypothetical protein
MQSRRQGETASAANLPGGPAQQKRLATGFFVEEPASGFGGP